MERVVSGNFPILQRTGGEEELVCYKRSVLMVRMPGVLFMVGCGDYVGSIIFRVNFI